GELPDARRGCGGRDDGDTAAVLEKQSQDVPLHPVVVRHDVATRVRRPFAVLGADGRLGREIETVHGGARGERGAYGVVRLLADRYGAAHRALRADVARDLACVHVGDEGDARGAVAIGEQIGRAHV